MTAAIVPPALDAAAAEVKTYLRIEGAQEDELVRRLVASGALLCEAFTGRWLLARAGSEMVTPGPAWRRLAAAPVRAIIGLEALASDGSAVPLPIDAYAIDIDPDGRGWVRILRTHDGKRVRVRFEAGLAETWAELPESLRHGVVRLAAHLYTQRGGEAGGEPPAAVTAMWRPWRRLEIGGRGHV